MSNAMCKEESNPYQTIHLAEDSQRCAVLIRVPEEMFKGKVQYDWVQMALKMLLKRLLYDDVLGKIKSSEDKFIDVLKELFIIHVRDYHAKGVKNEKESKEY